MTDYLNCAQDEFIPSTLQSTNVGGKYFGVPQATDAGFIYYDTNKIKKLPSTWQGLYSAAKPGGGIVYQGAAYEGLTVNFLELAFAAGGKVLSSDGKKAEIDSPQNLKALNFMVDGDQERRRPEGRHDLHGGAGQARLPVGQVRRDAQLALRLRAGRRPRRSASTSPSRRSRPSRAAARPASSAATTS